MKISIIGAGNIGGTLGKKWADKNHSVTFGVRNPADPKHADITTIGAVTSIDEALMGAEVILLSLPGSAVADFATQFGANLNDKIVIDATNNPGALVMNNLAALQQHAPQAHFVRAFSTLGGENFATPQIDNTQIDLFYCGHAASRPISDRLIADVGLRPVYVGELNAVDLVDGMTRLWFALAFGQGKGRRIAFKLLQG